MDVLAWKLTNNHKSLVPIVDEDYNLVTYYLLGQMVRPPVGKIFCFSHLKHIKDYSENLMTEYPHEYTMNNLEVLKGIAHNVGYPLKLAKYVDDAEDFWYAKYHKNRITVETMDVPKGTISCDSFLPEKSFSLEEFLKMIESIKALDDRLLL